MTKELWIALVVLLVAGLWYGGIIMQGLGSYPTQQRDLRLSLASDITDPVTMDRDSLHVVLPAAAGPIARNPFDLSSDVQERGISIPMPQPVFDPVAPPSLVLWEELE